MWIPFRKKHNTLANKFLAVEINTHSIAALAFYTDAQEIKIIGSAKQPLVGGSVRAGMVIDKERVNDTLLSTIAEASETCEGRVTTAIFGVSGDMALGLTTTAKAHRHTTSQITPKEDASLFNKITEAAYIQAQNEYLDRTGNDDIALEITTSTTVYTKTDNSFTSGLPGKTGTEVEAAVFNAFSPTYHVKTLHKVAKNAGLKLVAIAPTLYSVVQAIKNGFSLGNDFVLINIGDDTTDTAVVFGGGIVATKTLCIGFSHFVESISEKMGLTYRESEKVLISYCTGKLTQSENVIVQKCARDTLDAWLDGIELLFGEFSGVKTFAPNICVTGEGILIPDLFNILKETPWTKAIPFKATPVFRKVGFSDLNRISDSTGQISSPAWVPLASLGSLYLELHK